MMMQMIIIIIIIIIIGHINEKTTKIKSFEYKTEIIGIIPTNNKRLVAEVVSPLKYLSKFWRSLQNT